MTLRGGLDKRGPGVTPCVTSQGPSGLLSPYRQQGHTHTCVRCTHVLKHMHAHRPRHNTTHTCTYKFVPTRTHTCSHV